jgi:23S rRNA (cytosine1962-C5)-methyltransferase
VKRVHLRTTRAGGQPLVFRKMVASADPGTGNGEVVEVVDDHERVLGRGFYNRKSELAVRLLERGEGPDLDAAWLRARLARCLALRRDDLGLDRVTDAYRVVNSEGDGLSGLVVDRYADVLTVQILALGWYRMAVEVKDALRSLLKPRAMVVRGDAAVEKIEGFRIYGDHGDGGRSEIREHGVRYLVDPARGHKTGFFLDQRDHRLRLMQRAKGRRVLDLCCYSGGFGLAAMKGGAAEVIGIDLDEEAVAMARENGRLNKAPGTVSFEHGDAFDALRGAKPGRFDAIVCDPPKLAANRDALPGALRKYEDMNALAFEKVAPGGLVVSCSCSGLVSEGEFLGVLSRAALRANRDVRVIEVGGAGADHPWALHHGAGRYLKVVWSQVG